MKEVYKFKIDKALSEAVEARQLELTGLERLYWSTLSTTAYVIPQEKIKTLQDEYIKVNAEYEMLKTKVNNLIPEECLFVDDKEQLELNNKLYCLLKEEHII